jgi:hypothetical protein
VLAVAAARECKLEVPPLATQLPGWIDTSDEHETFGRWSIADAVAKLPWGRLDTPPDIGDAAVLLAWEDADYITGTTLLVDGDALRGALTLGAPLLAKPAERQESIGGRFVDQVGL